MITKEDELEIRSIVQQEINQLIAMLNRNVGSTGFMNDGHAEAKLAAQAVSHAVVHRLQDLQSQKEQLKGR